MFIDDEHAMRRGCEPTNDALNAKIVYFIISDHD